MNLLKYMTSQLNCIVSIPIRIEDPTSSSTELDFISLHMDVMNQMENSTEIAKTFHTFKLCHVNKPKRSASKKRNPMDSQLSSIKVEEVIFNITKIDFDWFNSELINL